MLHGLKQPCDEGVIRAARAVARPDPATGRWVLAAAILGSSMAFIDSTVVNVALPALQRELNATIADVQWVVESYALFLAALMLVGGSMGDHFGRRRIFAAGVGLFAVASIWCGSAPNTGQLIIARGVQGIGGALLVPGSLAIISTAFSGEERGRAIGLWSGFTAITAALGPVLGGWLVEHASWRWVFFMNIPLAVLVLALLFWRVPESRDDAAPPQLDWWGALLVTIGLGTVVYGLIEAPGRGWSHPTVLGALTLGTVALLAFFAVEARSGAPMMPLTLFRSRTFSGANLLTLLLYAALGGALFWLPFNLIQVQGYSATAAGAALLPFILIMFPLSRWSGGLVHRYGARRPLIVGPSVAAAGFALFALPTIGGSYWTTFFPAAVVLGVGMAISVAPLTTTVMGAVESRHAGLASGINNTVARTAAVLAIAINGVIMLHAFNGALDDRLTTLDIQAATRQLLDAERVKLAGAEIPAGLGEETAGALERAIDESFVSSFRLIMFLAAGLALASALVAARTIEVRSPARLPTRDGPRIPAQAE